MNLNYFEAVKDVESAQKARCSIYRVSNYDCEWIM